MLEGLWGSRPRGRRAERHLIFLCLFTHLNSPLRTLRGGRRGGGWDQFIISICLHSPSPFLSSHFCPSLSVFVCTFAFFCFSCDWVLFIRFLKLVLPEFLSFLVGFSVKFVSFLHFRFLLTALEAIFYFLRSRFSACFLKATYFIFMVLSSVIFLYVAPKAYQLPLYLLLLFTLKEHPSIFFFSS